MKQNSSLTQKYFRSKASDFDKFYEGSNLFRKYFDLLFRAGIYDRYRIVFEKAGDVSGKSVLDVGCGTGRYCIEFLKRGAHSVYGIDFADNMLEIARELLSRTEGNDRCKLIKADFMNYDFGDSSFDVVIAVGFFDYINDPLPYLEKMYALTKCMVLATFPVRSPLRMPLRKIRYYFKRCPVYFTTRKKLIEASEALHPDSYELIPCKSSGYVVMLKKVKD